MAVSLDLRIAPKTVQRQVVDKLRHAIVSGEFPSGERLVESELQAALGVSRSSLREALRCLEAEHLVEMVPNRGPQIPQLSWEEAEEIYEVRELLEGEAAARCAASMNEAQLTALSGRLAAFERAVCEDNASEQIRMAGEFFEIILQGCGNRIIEQIQAGLLARVSRLRARSMSLPGRAMKSFEEMKAIYVAIKLGDASEARKTAMQHVANARASAKKTFAVK